MSEERVADGADGLMTVDQLARATGTSVRTARYYASLGILPAPERIGRVAYYGPRHRARLELIRSLQADGYTLAAIERYLARIPADATVEDLALQRAMLTPWTERRELLTQAQLESRAGRALGDDEVDQLVGLGVVRRDGERFEALSPLEIAVEMIDLGIPAPSMVEAGEAIDRHMEALADELTEILRTRVLAPFREQPHSAEEKVRFEHTVSRLRQLTLDAVVAGFRRAANEVVQRSLSRS